jgi:uncharacterized membrane protein
LTNGSHDEKKTPITKFNIDFLIVLLGTLLGICLCATIIDIPQVFIQRLVFVGLTGHIQFLLSVIVLLGYPRWTAREPQPVRITRRFFIGIETAHVKSQLLLISERTLGKQTLFRLTGLEVLHRLGHTYDYLCMESGL